MAQQGEHLPQTEEEVIPLILKIAPGFQERWEKHLAHWKGESAGVYNEIAEFAHYVVDSYDNKDTSWYGDFFKTIERMLTEGNAHMQELAGIGFLEDIQTISSWKKHKGKVFIKWLGPKSKEVWGELDKLWSEYGSLANIIRAENKQDK